jgi:O-antigen/teichoic acid export membrane protein
MFLGFSLFNLFNLFYHFFMVRNLNPSDYGQLNALMALFMIITVPANTVQTTITRFVSIFQASSQQAQTRGFLKHFMQVMVTAAFFFLLAVTLGSQVLATFLQIPSVGLVFLLGVILFFAMVTPIPWGGLQGLQRFGLLAVNLILNGGLKLGLGVLLVIGGWGVLGAIGAVAIAYFITASLSLLQVEWLMRKESRKDGQRSDRIKSQSSTFSEAYRFFFPVGIMLLCFMILTQIDLILVKHLFTPIEAGYYSIAQMVGKVILFLPLPVVMVMFPKVSLMEAQGKKSFPVLIQSLMISGILGASGIVISHLFPTTIIQVLARTVYPECIPLVRLFSINMTLFSLTLILLYYHLATQKRGFIYPLLSMTLIQIGLIALFHQTMIQILSIVTIVAFLLFGINLYLARRAGYCFKKTQPEEKWHER